MLTGVFVKSGVAVYCVVGAGRVGERTVSVTEGFDIDGVDVNRDIAEVIVAWIVGDVILASNVTGLVRQLKLKTDTKIIIKSFGSTFIQIPSY